MAVTSWLEGVCGAANPNLSTEHQGHLVRDLMDARRRVHSTDPELKALARRDVDAAKHALGERGPVWWDDGAPDYSRRMAVNTPYREWFEKLDRPVQIMPSGL